jgi:hypothetical protein
VKEGEELKGDSWAELLAKAKAEQAKAITSENLGRGGRRRAAVQAAAQVYLSRLNIEYLIISLIDQVDASRYDLSQ